ncbi:hypothetical protein CDAR_24371 [Caerostris darwini]|uniref:Uncharacterized protein n=1 Tax=Caerostris darwini TaxID=1538125 RepID=A0AAV4QK74_9ARAC|nr:hypothetical protein CDAR_24371 [Caerostris darwini]
MSLKRSIFLNEVICKKVHIAEEDKPHIVYHIFDLGDGVFIVLNTPPPLFKQTRVNVRLYSSGESERQPTKSGVSFKPYSYLVFMAYDDPDAKKMYAFLTRTNNVSEFMN